MKKMVSLFVVLSLLSSFYKVSYAENKSFTIMKSAGYDSIPEIEAINKDNFVYTGKKGNRYSIISNNIKVGEYDEIYLTKYYSKSNNIIFKVTDNNLSYIVIDGKKFGKGYEDIYDIYYDQKTGNLFFYGFLDGKNYVVKNGVEIGKDYDYVHDFTILPETNTYMYIAGKNGKSYVIQNGDILGEYDYVSGLQYYGDNKHSYIVKKNNEYFIVKNGIEIGDNYSYIEDIKYSPDKSSFTYMATKNGKKIIIKDNQKIGGEYYQIWKYEYSDNGQSFYMIVVKNDQKMIIKDGVELVKIDLNEYQDIYDSYFIPNTEELIYVTYVEGKYSIIIDGVTYGPFDKIENIDDSVNGKYSLDGKNYGFSVIQGNSCYLFINKQKIGTEYDCAYSLVFSPNSNSYSYIAKKNNQYFVVSDRKEGPKYDGISNLNYSADGSKISYTGIKNNQQHLIQNEKIIANGDSIQYKYANNGSELTYSNISYKSIKNTIFKDNLKIGEYNYSPLSSFHYFKNDNSLYTKYVGSDGLYYIEFITQESEGSENFIAPKTKYIKQAIVSKSQIKRKNNGEKYINQIDSMNFSQVKIEVLEKYLSKIQTLKKSKNHPVLDYLEAKIWLAINNR